MASAKAILRFPAGTVDIPSSKSISHRALICAGLAALQNGGQSILTAVGDNDDTRATCACLQALGISLLSQANTLCVTHNESAAPTFQIDCNESGSTLRFMIPIAATLPSVFHFTGRGRLMQRPLDIYERIFKEKGLLWHQTNDALTLQGPLPAGEYHLPGNVSSQFISGLLFALPLLPQSSRIVLDTALESSAYVALTLDTMKTFGVQVQQPDAHSYFIPGGQQYTPQPYRVEADWSQAAFFLAAGALGQPVACNGLVAASLQGDSAIADILQRMGASIIWQNGQVTAQHSQLTATDIDVREIPDLVPILAVLCSFAQGTSHIIGAARLRLKESDRLAAMTSELRKLGASIEEGPDSLTITGKPQLNGGTVDAHGDHRIAMAMAVAAIRCKNPVHLTGWEHVKKSYPHFWADFEKEAIYG